MVLKYTLFFFFFFFFGLFHGILHEHFFSYQLIRCIFLSVNSLIIFSMKCQNKTKRKYPSNFQKGGNIFKLFWRQLHMKGIWVQIFLQGTIKYILWYCTYVIFAPVRKYSTVRVLYSVVRYCIILYHIVWHHNVSQSTLLCPACITS